jgi:hypothetical protein
MKEEILKLRKEGKSYNKICAITGAARSTVVYHCSPHQKECAHRRRQKHCRQHMNELKNTNGGKCRVCGYNRCLDALDFHHLDPLTKDRTYHAMSAILRSCSLEKAKQEVAKCILVCANCHREIHAGLIAPASGIAPD